MLRAMDFREPCKGSSAFEKKMVATCRNQEIKRRKNPNSKAPAATESKVLTSDFAWEGCAVLRLPKRSKFKSAKR